MDLGFQMVNSPLLTDVAKSTPSNQDQTIASLTGATLTAVPQTVEAHTRRPALSIVVMRARRAAGLCSLSKVSVAPTCSMEAFLLAPTATAARPSTSSLDPLPMV